MSQSVITPQSAEQRSGAPSTVDLPAARPLAVRSFGLTDAGKVRPRNEDQFLIAVLRKALRIEQSSLPQAKTQYGDEEGRFFLVADGVGGHQAGEQASALAVVSLEAYVLNTLKWFLRLRGSEGQDVLSELRDALARADARVFEEAAEHPELRGMATTVTLAYSLGDRLFVVHAGDSRCYLFRNGELHRLTRDHTLVQELVRLGQLSEEQAARHQFRHVVTNVVGGTDLGVRADVHKIDLEAGDRVLLCTDGLTEMLADDQIAAALRAEPESRGACERLVAEANERGGKDNVTVIVARYEAP